MPTRSARLYSIALIIGDFVTLFVAFTLAYIVRVKFDPRPLLFTDIGGVDFIITFLVIAPFWIFIFSTLGLYSSTIYSRRLAEMGRLLVGSFIGILLILGYAFVTKDPVFPARLVAVYAFVGSFVFLVINREFLRFVRTILFRYGKGISRVLLIGSSKAVKDIADSLSDTRKSGYLVSAIAGPINVLPKSFNGSHFSDVEEALKKLDRLRITTIIQTELYPSAERNQLILGAAQTRHINYSFIPGESEFYSGKNTIDVFLGYPIISVHQTPLVGWGAMAKRIFDLAAVSLGILVLSPVLLLVVLLQKILNPGPVFYKNPRLSRYGKKFQLYKFRSMKHGRKGGDHQDSYDEFTAMGRKDLAEEYKKYRKVVSQRDPRITAFGNFLRKTSIDELPQLINVLRGEMSLVGPRPIEPVELPRYQGRGALLHSVRPGVTGLWQVSGRNDLSFDKRVELELYYAQNWSFWLDLKLLLKTIPALLRKSGAR